MRWCKKIDPNHQNGFQNWNCEKFCLPLELKCNGALDVYYGDPGSIISVENGKIDFNFNGTRKQMNIYDYDEEYKVKFCKEIEDYYYNDFNTMRMGDETYCRDKYLILDIVDLVCATFGILAGLILICLTYDTHKIAWEYMDAMQKRVLKSQVLLEAQPSSEAC